MQKVGILGGTFDPVHWGHLLIAETTLNQVALEQVIWVPTRYPSYKQTTEFEHRLEMVARAIRDRPNFVISPIEATESGKPSYAIDTLINLKAHYPGTHWYWIVGLDAFQTLPRWYRRQELVVECDWLVAPRLSTDVGTTQSPKISNDEMCQQVVDQLANQSLSIRWQLLRMAKVGISSSLIRQYCRDAALQTPRDRDSIRHLVPDAVRSYILDHNLYSPRSR